MATNHTENYALNLWEPTDSFLREEFNENFGKIDAALMEHRIVGGTFTALGTQAVEVHLGFRPMLLFFIGGEYNAISLAFEGEAYVVYNRDGHGYVTQPQITITDDGFSVFSGDSFFNYRAGQTVRYIALC